MSRLLAPDGAVKQVDVHGRTFDLRSGSVTVDDPATARALRKEGFTPAGVGPARTPGRTCVDCGFGSYFLTCSRCGGTCS